MPTNPRARSRLLELLAEPVSGPEPDSGIVDLLGGAAQAGPPTGLAQRLMRIEAVTRVYERYWRPAFGAAAKGFRGPSMAGEVTMATELLALAPGKTVLDVACGTGRFTRAFGEAVGTDGLAIGLDGSRQMLGRAVAAENLPESVAFVRADATALPFQSSTVDAICCFAALHLFADPEAALDSFAATLRPGGRVAIFTSARHPWLPARVVSDGFGFVTGIRMFDRGEIADRLRARGFTQITEHHAGVTQVVAGTAGAPR
ncbi:class I SAM-dependent methyltransferase [Amycolatopsis aidingensis]|uniref:class I SAM-dependent methyltransferase n=1 Tax=Amycolatopsis aidingensis TaxID=2842453 RepID=UPI001E32DC68|nr:methyltransferase domain-containing protein [Amycolatopsis aidingensis]